MFSPFVLKFKRPTLGSALKQIIAVGISYMFFASAYGVTHAIEQEEGEMDKGQATMMIIIPLAVLEAGIYWWIFLCLSNTMRTLSLRGNTVKLALYTRFQWSLIVFVVLTVAFAMWSVYDHFDHADGSENWRNAWLQDG